MRLDGTSRAAAGLMIRRLRHIGCFCVNACCSMQGGRERDCAMASGPAAQASMHDDCDLCRVVCVVACVPRDAASHGTLRLAPSHDDGYVRSLCALSSLAWMMKRKRSMGGSGLAIAHNLVSAQPRERSVRAVCVVRPVGVNQRFVWVRCGCYQLVERRARCEDTDEMV